MKILHLTSGPLRANTYFLIDEKCGNTVVIDPGENYKIVRKTLDEYSLNLTAVFLTHAHFDHSSISRKLQQDGAKIYISEKDAPKLLNDDNLSKDFGRKFEFLTADETFNDGDEFEFGEIKIRVLITAGHTDGSACFIVGNSIFSGDTLFLESVGRTDFKTGNRDDIVASVKRLFALDGDYQVYPGHEEFTTLSHERKFNAFVDYD